MSGTIDPTQDRATLQPSDLYWALGLKAERVVLLTLSGGATCAFAALMRVAIKGLSGPSAHLAELAVAASLLHGMLLILLHFTHPRMIYIRIVHAHISGALLAGSFFGGLASIWH